MSDNSPEVPVHWRAVLEPGQIHPDSEVIDTALVVGFLEEKDASEWIAMKNDFGGWRYRLEPLYGHAALAAAEQRGMERMREMAASEAERMMMYPGGRQESAVHNNVWEAAKAIRALPITKEGEK